MHLDKLGIEESLGSIREENGETANLGCEHNTELQVQHH